MKRVFCLLLAASLFLLTGCFGKSEGEETSSENPAPTSSTVGEGDSSFIPASLPPLPDVHLTIGKIVNIIEGVMPTCAAPRTKTANRLDVHTQGTLS